jgi:hypothetical protein
MRPLSPHCALAALARDHSRQGRYVRATTRLTPDDTAVKSQPRMWQKIKAGRSAIIGCSRKETSLRAVAAFVEGYDAKPLNRDKARPSRQPQADYWHPDLLASLERGAIIDRSTI